MHLGHDVGPAVGGAALGDVADRHAGGVDQDFLGQIGGAKERQVVAIGELSHPCALVISDVGRGPPSPPSRQLVETVLLLGGAGLEGRSLAQLYDLGRAWLASMGGGILVD